MSEQPTPTNETNDSVTMVTPADTTRVFKIGTARIPENDTTRGKSAAEVQGLLQAAYPEVANATVRERVEGEYQIVEYLPQPGRKG